MVSTIASREACNRCTLFGRAFAVPATRSGTGQSNTKATIVATIIDFAISKTVTRFRILDWAVAYRKVFAVVAAIAQERPLHDEPDASVPFAPLR